MFLEESKLLNVMVEKAMWHDRHKRAIVVGSLAEKE